MSETSKKRSPGALGGKVKKKKYIRKNNRLSGMPRSHAAAPEGLMHYLVGVTDKLRGISAEQRDKIGGVLPKGLMQTRQGIPQYGDNYNRKKKKITPAKQKNINQAAPVIKRIVEGNKPKVKFTSKPEKPLSPAVKRKQIKKQSKKYGGKIKNRNMGGVIGGGLASQDVTDYLYKYDS